MIQYRIDRGSWSFLVLLCCFFGVVLCGISSSAEAATPPIVNVRGDLVWLGIHGSNAQCVPFENGFFLDQYTSGSIQLPPLNISFKTSAGSIPW